MKTQVLILFAVSLVLSTETLNPNQPGDIFTQFDEWKVRKEMFINYKKFHDWMG